jgi:membrane protein DedA with SNARE-associated domain
LPFKVFTITSGIIGFNIMIFFFICLWSRGLRFFVVSYLSYKFGHIFNKFIENNGAKWFAVAGVIIVVVAVIVYFVIK